MKDHRHERSPAPPSGESADHRSQAAGFGAYVLAGMFLWAVWNESASLHTLVQGGLLTWLALFLSSRFFLHASYAELFRIHPLTLLRFAGVLIIAIFQSGLHAIYILLTGRIHLGIIDLPTQIDDPFHGVMVANAITLTPGTVTVEYEKGIFKVVWIDCLTEDPQIAAEKIKGRFERVFLRPDRKRSGADG